MLCLFLFFALFFAATSAILFLLAVFSSAVLHVLNRGIEFLEPRLTAAREWFGVTVIGSSRALFAQLPKQFRSLCSSLPMLIEAARAKFYSISRFYSGGEAQ